MRGLNDKFMDDLMKGGLKQLLEEIKQDDTLDLQIRENYINIYYRGGNLLKLEQSSGNSVSYKAEFDWKYTQNQTSKLNLSQNIDEKTLGEWISAIPELKYYMDRYFHQHPKIEREFAQNFVRENNRIAPNSDYFVCDVEYKFNGGQFDAIAVRWDSTSQARRNPRNLRLSFLEFKFGDGALQGDSGIQKHINDLQVFVRGSNMPEFKTEMKKVFNQKRQLGYIENQNDIENFSDDKLEYIFILANHDPDSTVLKDILENIKAPDAFDLRFANANFFGSGLYKNNILLLEDFKKFI